MKPHSFTYALSPLKLCIDFSSLREKMAKLTAELKAVGSKTPIAVHASPSIVAKLRSDFPASSIVVNRAPPDSICLAKLKVIEHPYILDGAYAIEYADGSFEWHGAMLDGGFKMKVPPAVE